MYICKHMVKYNIMYVGKHITSTLQSTKVGTYIKYTEMYIRGTLQGTLQST